VKIWAGFWELVGFCGLWEILCLQKSRNGFNRYGFFDGRRLAFSLKTELV